MIREAGGAPAFKGYRPGESYPPFPATICASINEEVVHGIPSKERILKDGDILSIDIGMKYAKSQKSKVFSQKSYFVDTAVTIPIGKIPEKIQQLIDATKQALEIGIGQCHVGQTIADIGKAIQSWVEPQGYGIVRDLVGHGVGHALHEDPRVPNYFEKELEAWKLEPGVVIAIEPMITMGSWRVKTGDDKWTIVTKDKSLSAHFEHTVIVTEDGPVVATRRPGE